MDSPRLPRLVRHDYRAFGAYGGIHRQGKATLVVDQGIVEEDLFLRSECAWRHAQRHSLTVLASVSPRASGGKVRREEIEKQ